VRSGARAAIVRIAGALAITVLLVACSSPLARIEDRVERAGFHREVVSGTRYRHVVFDNAVRRGDRPLAVYLEGDGSPYRGRYWIAAEPTSRQPLMLELMATDRGPAVYVGRPCYLGLADDPPCTPVDWTTGRFAEDIVASLCAVIEQLALARGDVQVQLYGHSGGGTLAVLIARRLGRVTQVITLAGNLDPHAWTRLHHYARLADSLDPLEGGSLPPGITQLHVAGEHDRNVPPAMIDAAARRLGASGARVLPGVSHTRGWLDYWPALRAGQ
jgi:pimeloyl-ACP methyl ester carboxylesterase